MAIRLDKLLEAWRNDPRPKATVEFCSMLVRASSKAGPSNQVPAEFVIEFGEEAIERHRDELEVAVSVASLYVTTGELDRAERLLAELIAKAPGDARVSKLMGKVRLHRGIRGGESVPPAGMPAGIRFGASEPPPPAPSHASTPPPEPVVLLEGPGPSAPPPERRGSVLDELPEKRPVRRQSSGSFAPPPVYTETGEPMPEITSPESTADPDDDAPTNYRPVPEEARRAAMAPAHAPAAPAPPSDPDPSTSVMEAPALPPDAGEDAERKQRRRALGPPRQPTVRGMGPDDPMVQAALEARRLRSGEGSPVPAAGGVELFPPEDDGEVNTLLVVPPPPPLSTPPVPAAAAGLPRMPTLQSPLPRPLPAAGRPAIEDPPTSPVGEDPAPPVNEDSEGDGPRTVIKTQRMDAVDIPRHFHPGATQGFPSPEAVGATTAALPVSGIPASGFPPSGLPASAAVPSSVAPMSPPLFQGVVSNPAPQRPDYPPELEFPNAQTQSLPQLPLLRPGDATPPPANAGFPSGVVITRPPEPAPAVRFGEMQLASRPRRAAPPVRPTSSFVLRIALLVFTASAVLGVCFVVYIRLFGGDRSGGADGPAIELGRFPEIEAQILAGGPRELAAAGRAIDENADASTNPTLAIARVRARSLAALDGAESIDVASAIASARALEVSDVDLAYADVARALGAGHLDEVADLLARWEPEAALRSDAFYQLASGVALERLGRDGAIARYQSALGGEPRLQPAELRLVRGLLMYGDVEEGLRRAQSFAERRAGTPEAKLVAALAWAAERRRKGSTTPPGVLPAEDDLPGSLRAVLPAIELLAASDDRARQRLFDRGVAGADAPIVATYYGDLALELDQPRWALRAADRGLELVAGHAPSLSVLGRAAIETGQLDRLTEAIGEAPTGTAVELEAALAYEKGDFERLAKLASGLNEEGSGANPGLVARFERMRGKAPLSPEQISRLKASAVVGGTLVIADAHLDAGDIDAARETIDAWKDRGEHPLRALRYARLLRYERKLEESRAALESASPTRPAQIERLLLEAETPEGRTHALAVLGNHLEPERPFFEAYLKARDGDFTAASDAVAAAREPGPDAPRSHRLAAALAYGELEDFARGERVIRDLLLAFPNDLDVIRAGVGLRLLPRSRLEEGL